ncbi:DEAD/DEAH box helicase family protein [candidate division KSB1 bacterium]|nr:DEAD/DEAH box helicase family protein [candidate division KSB1 bacterium]NIR68583.1 DEAD/DEAH box helicase family protein [candidate division KSB1 bacterium]NIS25420.1 DEAD/DEAH box helicase family protein [candidate division KSB1 bacterium]NIT72312.1 DEAD/DEAH box helicase family protein [candidate division KSB1 bacterium]NIU26096.1 DEAD/DEAH box helicase family protein [candidate division KSB1 bacterium]
MSTKLDKYFSESAILQMQAHIQEADGNEVFLVGYLDDQRLVENVEVFARGNETSAPALMQVARQGNVVIHNHPSGALPPSPADLQVASVLGNDGIGFYIVNNAVSDIFVVVEPFIEKGVVQVDFKSLAELFTEDGLIAHTLENFEFRRQQIQMIKLISEAINTDSIAMIEAGTGTGKTLAYLLPAIHYAVNNEERIVVSTNTINLQEQLIYKDLPFLRKVLDQDFKAVLVKGRTNYACKRKLAEATQELDLFAEKDEQAELKAILDWSKTSKDGSKSDLNIEPRRDVWEKIQSESDTSLKTKCPFYNECFFYTARRKAATADILVANHHLLFSDLAVRAVSGASENAVLPQYDRIVFDEAHNVEDVATSYFGVSITYLGVLRVLNRIYRKKDGEEKGLLPFLKNRLVKYARLIPHDKFDKAHGFIENDGLPGLEKLNYQLTECMEQIFTTVREGTQTDYGEVKLRLTSKVLRQPAWQETILPLVRKLVQDIRRYTAKLSKMLAQIESVKHKLGSSVPSLTVDLQAQSDRLQAASNTIEHVLLESDEANVRWLEVRQGYKNTKIVRLRSAPLEIAPIMKEKVYNQFNNVSLTSATLTVESKFDYLKNRLGLDLVDPTRLLTSALPAPFDYERQTLVAIPADLPDPRHASFAEKIRQHIVRSVEISGGRAFILFTSYGLLNVMHNRLKRDLEKFGCNVYRQGEENRHRLLQRFKEDESSVLFATDSFWEGVDVPGKSLELVVITKLPFKVPSEPIIQARIEAIECRGRNAFMEYTVPQAVIKLRQGFGRLIRSRTDRGAVLILDKRVIYKSYGRMFLESLPPCRVVAGPSTEVFPALENFFREERVIPVKEVS